ncbi:hypothetical protein PRV_00060 [Mycoplasma parvum str. Indiana]|uniref:Uncharacterized protein n=1 Tax=Mycoplasma parvum str. Indiana TaxID=1403316 RepID=U5NEZ3_9MOLU|nr:hypothetical protein PRV_00060 [Mycoplasma parvum str. Indiana]
MCNLIISSKSKFLLFSLSSLNFWKGIKLGNKTFWTFNLANSVFKKDWICSQIK